MNIEPHEILEQTTEGTLRLHYFSIFSTPTLMYAIVRDEREGGSGEIWSAKLLEHESCECLLFTYNLEDTTIGSI